MRPLTALDLTAPIAMPKFEVFSHDVLIGWSELEGGDPPVGVASGRFLPSEAYSSIQAAVAASKESSQSHFGLRVRVSGGEFLNPDGGVYLEDYSSELGAEEMRIFVLGLGYPQYRELFPEHVATYERL